MTAELECLLDDVVVGKQEMVGAIDAVCSVAERIIGKLKEGGTAGGPPLLGAAVGNGPETFPPTPAMKRFADSLARQKGIKPSPGYKTSISICRKFLNEHAAPQSTATTKRPRKRKADAAAAPPAPAQANSVAGTPLRIPYGNKDVALKLGARYGSAGWYAPPGVDLSAF